MKLLRDIFRIFIIIYLAVLLQSNVVYGLVELLDPSYWFKKIIKIITNPLNPLNILPWDNVPLETTTERKIERIPPVNIEPYIFSLAPQFQTFYNPSDIQAKENYIMSPLCAGISLGEILIGTHGFHHESLASAMGLSHKITRQSYILQETQEPMYNEEIRHATYHFRLSVLAGKVQSDEEDDKLELNDALFYKRGIQIVNIFKEKIRKFYKSEFIPVDMEDMYNSTDLIQDWSAEQLDIPVANRTSKLINPEMDSTLLSTFLFNTTWQVPLKKARRKGDFNIKPYQTEKIKYLEGILNSTIYADLENFRLVALPLNHKRTVLYILLPKGADFDIYNIRQFSEDFNSFQQFQAALNDSVLQDIKLKMPDIFTQFIEFDLTKPLLNYINDENEVGDKPTIDKIDLNNVATYLKLDNVVQHMYFSINNKPPKPNITLESRSTDSRIVFESRMSTQSEDTVKSVQTVDSATSTQPNIEIKSSLSDQSSNTDDSETTIQKSRLPSQSDETVDSATTTKSSISMKSWLSIQMNSTQKSVTVESTATAQTDMDFMTTTKPNIEVNSRKSDQSINITRTDTQPKYALESQKTISVKTTKLNSSADLEAATQSAIINITLYNESTDTQSQKKSSTHTIPKLRPNDEKSSKTVRLTDRYQHSERGLSSDPVTDTSIQFFEINTLPAGPNHLSGQQPKNTVPNTTKYSPRTHQIYIRNTVPNSPYPATFTLTNPYSWIYQANRPVQIGINNNPQYTTAGLVSPRPVGYPLGTNLPIVTRRVKRNVKKPEPESTVIDFEVTRPFVFIVYDEDTNLVLLWGSIANPKKLQS